MAGTLKSSGKLVTGTFNEIVDDIEGTLETGISNKYVSTTLKVLLAFYAAFAAPHLPRSVASLLDHTVVRILIAVLIVYLATKDASLAILVALAFVLSLQTANKYKVIDTSRSVSVPGKLSWLPSQQAGHPGHSAGIPQPHSFSETNHAHVNLPTPQHHQVPQPSATLGSNIVGHHTTEHFTDGAAPSNHLSGHTDQGHQEHHHDHDNGSIHAPVHAVSSESMFTHHALPEHAQAQAQEHAKAHAQAPAHAHAQEPAHAHAHAHAQAPAHVATEHHQPPHPESVSMEHMPTQHTTEYADIQNNRVPGANQGSCTQSWSNENCPQGLNEPGGFDSNCGKQASF